MNGEGKGERERKLIFLLLLLFNFANWVKRNDLGKLIFWSSFCSRLEEVKNLREIAKRKEEKDIKLRWNNISIETFLYE